MNRAEFQCYGPLTVLTAKGGKTQLQLVLQGMLLPSPRRAFRGQGPVPQTPALPLAGGSHRVHFLDPKEDAEGVSAQLGAYFPFLYKTESQNDHLQTPPECCRAATHR